MIVFDCDTKHCENLQLNIYELFDENYASFIWRDLANKFRDLSVIMNIKLERIISPMNILNDGFMNTENIKLFLMITLFIETYDIMNMH